MKSLLFILISTFSLPVYADKELKKEFRKIGHAIKDGSKEVWSATKKTTKKVIKSTGKAIERVGDKIDDEKSK